MDPNLENNRTKVMVEDDCIVGNVVRSILGKIV